MKDSVGNVIALGDEVVCTTPGGSSELEHGEVVGFTPKNIRVNIRAYNKNSEDWYILRTSSQLCVIHKHPNRGTELTTLLENKTMYV